MDSTATSGPPAAAAELSGFQYVIRPGNHDVTLLLLHGTGGDEYDLLDLGAFLSPGSSLVGARGRAPEGTVNRWFARFSPGVLDEDDIRRRAEELSGFVSAVTRQNRLNALKVWAVGFSNGANMAAAMLLLRPGLFAGAVLFRPMLPLLPESVPDLAGIPVLIASGMRDTMIPRHSTEDLAALLTRSGAQAEVRWADAGHRFGHDEVEQARQWLERRLDLPGRKTGSKDGQ